MNDYYYSSPELCSARASKLHQWMLEWNKKHNYATDLLTDEQKSEVLNIINSSDWATLNYCGMLSFGGECAYPVLSPKNGIANHYWAMWDFRKRQEAGEFTKHIKEVADNG